MTKTITLTKPVDYEVKYLAVNANVRYWEDATVNDKDDSELIPCRSGDMWCPTIDIDTGQIINWTAGVTASVHYKVCDAGKYELMGENHNIIMEIDGYVPPCMSPGGNGYRDYIIMHIDENGFIDKWFFEAGFWEDYYEVYN